MSAELTLVKPQLRQKNSKWQKTVFNALNEPGPQLFLGALLMLTLFMADSWVLGNAPDSSNDSLYGILLAIFIVFSIECITLSIVQEGYFPYFFFWMDLIGTVSIILDIGWIAHLFIPSGTMSASGSVLRATRAAKLGARYGRLLRLLRLLKFVRFLPCFKTGLSDDFEPTMSAIKRVSEQLSARLSLRTAALVMIMVIVVPFLSYNVIDYSPNAWVTHMKMVAKNESTLLYDIGNVARKCNNFYLPKDSKVLYMKIESPWIAEPFVIDYDTRRTLRASNILLYSSDYYVYNSMLAEHNSTYADASKQKVYFNVELKMDMTKPNELVAMFNILLIVLVIIVLFVFTAAYSQAVNDLVVRPLEKMMTTLRTSALLMINSVEQLSSVKEKEDLAVEKKSNEEGEDSEEDDELEAAMLEKMVQKLSRIIKHVIPRNDNITVDENLDKATSNWLSQSYSSGGGSPVAGQAQESKIRTSLHYNSLRSSDDYSESAVTSLISKEVLNSWDLDMLEYTDNKLSEIMIFMFNSLGLLVDFQVPMATMRLFLGEISKRYIKNTYHNYNHGCDVCHTVYRLLMLSRLSEVFTPLEIFSTLIGALAHDVGHPGLNNLFLVKSKHPLALAHNDKSPLENMHCVTLYEVLMQDKFNIFVNLSSKEWAESRRIIIDIILGTDMVNHQKQISNTMLFSEINGTDTRAFCAGEKDFMDCFADDKNRLFVMELLLHCSDISNPIKPYKLCSKWADLVIEEFCQQGDKEKSMGLEVSPMCDRAAVSLCNMQMGFIEFVVAPLIIAVVNIFPTLHSIGYTMKDNVNSWGARRLQELAPSSSSSEATEESSPEGVEAKKLVERLQKWSDRMAFLDQLKSLPQRP